MVQQYCPGPAPKVSFRYEDDFLFPEDFYDDNEASDKKTSASLLKIRSPILMLVMISLLEICPLMMTLLMMSRLKTLKNCLMNP